MREGAHPWQTGRIRTRVDRMSLHPYGDVYQHWALDYVIEATRAVAQDLR